MGNTAVQRLMNLVALDGGSPQECTPFATSLRTVHELAAKCGVLSLDEMNDFRVSILLSDISVLSDITIRNVIGVFFDTTDREQEEWYLDRRKKFIILCQRMKHQEDNALFKSFGFRVALICREDKDKVSLETEDKESHGVEDRHKESRDMLRDLWEGACAILGADYVSSQRIWNDELLKAFSVQTAEDIMLQNHTKVRF